MKSSHLLPILVLLPAIASAVQITSEPFANGADPAAGEYQTGAANLIGQGPTIPGYSGTWLEAYGGAGFVGGRDATLFADGQAIVAREVVGFDGPANSRTRISLGAGAWGGAQKDAQRVDVGPTIWLDTTIGNVPARLSIDWRERVGGDAAPDSGIAATLSTRF